MFVAYTKRGNKVTSECSDWCRMFKRMGDIMDETRCDEDEAYLKFWKEVRDYDTEGFDEIIALAPKERTRLIDKINYAASYGYLDEIRIDYLEASGIEYKEENAV